MTHRRTFISLLTAAGLAVPLAVTLAATTPVFAQSSAPEEKAAVFVKATGERLVGIINGPGSDADKRAALLKAVDQTVDVDGIARFCLGRFWNKASPDQQKQYLQLFRSVLAANISSKLGQYQGVSFSMGRRKRQGDDAAVLTTVLRPNNPPVDVDWIIANPSGEAKIIDVVAEGTSLRLTQRQDYASFLSRNGESIDALISAMREQAK